MNNYEQLLNELLFGAKELIDKTKNISDKFDMSIKLAEQVTKTIEVMNQGRMVVHTQEVVMQPAEDKVIEAVKQVHLALTKVLNSESSQNEVNTNLNNEISSSVMAIYNDLKRSKSTMRISLSHLTTVLEINRFLEIFEAEYNSLNDLIGR